MEAHASTRVPSTEKCSFDGNRFTFLWRVRLARMSYQARTTLRTRLAQTRCHSLMRTLLQLPFPAIKALQAEPVPLRVGPHQATTCRTRHDVLKPKLSSRCQSTIRHA